MFNRLCAIWPAGYQPGILIGRIGRKRLKILQNAIGW